MGCFSLFPIFNQASFNSKLIRGKALKSQQREHRRNSQFTIMLSIGSPPLNLTVPDLLLQLWETDLNKILIMPASLLFSSRCLDPSSENKIAFQTFLWSFCYVFSLRSSSSSKLQCKSLLLCSSHSLDDDTLPVLWKTLLTKPLPQNQLPSPDSKFPFEIVSLK